MISFFGEWAGGKGKGEKERESVSPPSHFFDGGRRVASIVVCTDRRGRELGDESGSGREGARMHGSDAASFFFSTFHFCVPCFVTPIDDRQTRAPSLLC